MNNEEIWKDIEGYDGVYQVSDKGRVKSLSIGKEKILKPKRNTKGYLQVALYKNVETKWCYLHRLVAQSFLSNPNNLPQINHKNEDKNDNRVENLEWCSSKYNSNYGTRIQRFVEKKSKSVLQFDKEGNFIREWSSIIAVKNELGIDQSAITQCCKNKRKSAGKFVWRYKERKD